MTAEVLAWLGSWESAANTNYAEAISYLEESELLFRECGHLAGTAAVLLIAAEIALWQGNYALAKPKLDECLLLQTQLGQRGSPGSLVWLGRLHYWLGEYNQAQVHLENSYELGRRMGLSSGLPWASAFLGFVYLRRHEYSRALDYFRESLQTFRETGINAGPGIIFTVEGFASSAVGQGDAERATRLFAWADAEREVWQNVRPTNEQTEVERDMDAIREMIAEDSFATAYAEGQAMTLEEAMAYAAVIDAPTA